MTRPRWIASMTNRGERTVWHRQHPRRMWVTACGYNMGMPEQERTELSDADIAERGICEHCEHTYEAYQHRTGTYWCYEDDGTPYRCP